jgi:hypothetical protein
MNRMETHVKVVAVLFIVMGALNLIAALFFGLGIGIAEMALGMSDDADARAAMPIVGIAGTGLVIFLLALGIPPVITAIGLLRRREWARIAGIVISALLIFHLPIGTAVGIYGLWALLNGETARLMGEESRPAV